MFKKYLQNVFDTHKSILYTLHSYQNTLQHIDTCFSRYSFHLKKRLVYIYICTLRYCIAKTVQLQKH